MNHLIAIIFSFFAFFSPHFGSTITTTNSSDTLNTFRTNTNTNLANLNADKLESGSTAATLTITQLINTLASTSQISVFKKAYFGGTATTTIDVSGNVLIPSGSNLTITGKSDGCATFASGQLNSTGSACSSGTLTIGSGGTGTTTAPVSQLLYGGASAYQSVATSSISVSAGLTNTGTLGAQVGGSALTLKQIENRNFTASSTATFVGTTTIPLEIGYGEVWNSIRCFTDVGTVNVQVGYGTASTSMFNASTTIGTIALSSNNTMTSGNKVMVDIGTPASSPTKLTCGVNDTN
jgi:hypothetical protein